MDFKSAPQIPCHTALITSLVRTLLPGVATEVALIRWPPMASPPRPMSRPSTASALRPSFALLEDRETWEGKHAQDDRGLTTRGNVSAPAQERPRAAGLKTPSELGRRRRHVQDTQREDRLLGKRWTASSRPASASPHGARPSLPSLASPRTLPEAGCAPRGLPGDMTIFLDGTPEPHAVFLYTDTGRVTALPRQQHRAAAQQCLPSATLNRAQER